MRLWPKIGLAMIALSAPVMGGLPGTAMAQVVGDRTLPFPSLIMRPETNHFEITGGSQLGGNLFHSFEQFSIPLGGRASFRSIDPGVSRVIGRVTGSLPSRINGTLSLFLSDGDVSGADLFFINPNGIIVGPGAALNVGGSFLATTAETMTFADGTTFSSRSIPDSSLLTLSVPIGLQFGNAPGPIRYRGTAFNEPSSPLTSGSLPSGRLRVPSGQTLALVGGDLTIRDGRLNANGGRIELGSIGANTAINLVTRPSIIRLQYDTTNAFQSITLNNAVLETRQAGAGAIRLRGNDVVIRHDSRFLAESFESQDGQDIRIRANQLHINDSELVTAHFGSGRGGNIRVIATDAWMSHSELSTGVRADPPESIADNLALRTVVGTGQGGDIVLVADTITMRNGARLVSSVGSGATGEAGDIDVTARFIRLIGGAIATETNSDRVNVDALEPLPLNVDSDQFTGTGFQATVQSGARGRGGDITIESDHLILREGAQVLTDTFGLGPSGNITVNATTMVLDGVARQADKTPIMGLFGDQAVTVPSTVSSVSSSDRRGGDIHVRTQQLHVLNGATLQSSTRQGGNAGNLVVQASGAVLLDGTVMGSPSGLYSFSGGIPQLRSRRNTELGDAGAIGNGGNLRLTTKDLVIQNNAVIAVSSLGREDRASERLSNRRQAGTIDIDADTIQFLNQGSLLSTSAAVNGGNIMLEGDRFLFLDQSSILSSTAGSAEAGGNGGNITIESAFIVARRESDSDITANAFTGRGGDITITTQGLYGIEFSPQETAFSDITASSQFGVDGNLTLITPGIDPSRGLSELPGTLLGTEDRIEQTICRLTATTDSQFMVTGWGGLPPTPHERLTTEDIWRDRRLVYLDSQPLNSSLFESPRTVLPSSLSLSTQETTSTTPITFIEAQYWQRDQTGTVQLVVDTAHFVSPHHWNRRDDFADVQRGPSCSATDEGMTVHLAVDNGLDSMRYSQ